MMPFAPQPRQPKVVVTTEWTRHEHAQLTALAKAHGVSLRGFIKQAVGFALDNMDGGEG
jgi:hypothetical protein